MEKTWFGNRKMGALAAASLTAALMLLINSLSPLHAQGDDGKKWALVIGISNYTNAEPLRYAASDARAFAEFLQSPRGGGIPEDQVFTLLEDQASRFGIFSELELMQDRVAPGDTVFIFVAGHGYVNRRGIGYFVPSDGDLKLLAPTSIPFTSFKELVELGLSRVRYRILISDLCHAGRIGPETSELSSQIQNLINQELLDIKAGGGGFLNLLGSRPTEPSWERDDLGGGVFSHVLLKALNGEAAEEPAEAIQASQVVAYVTREVPKFTANQQHPMVNDEFPAGLTLAFPHLPGPQQLQPETPVDHIRLLFEKAHLSPFVRVQWLDPQTGAKVVHHLPQDGSILAVEGLLPGDYEFRLFTSQRLSYDLPLALVEEEEVVDLSQHPRDLARREPPLFQIASIFPASSQGAPLQNPTTGVPEVPSARLLVDLPGETEIWIDDLYYGETEAGGEYLQLGGLSPGTHRIRLASAVREYRYRIDLFPGEQILDWKTGQIRAVVTAPRSPAQMTLPVALPAEAVGSYRRFHEALWKEQLLEPAGRSAWDYFQTLAPTLPAPLRDRTTRDLIVAMGNRAQRIVLQYLRGGDIRWSAEIFQEGALLLERVQSIFQPSPALSSLQSFFAGRALIELGDYANGAASLRESIRLQPDASHAYNALGLALWKQDRLEEAIPFLETAIELSPDWTYPRTTLALIRLEMRLYDEAEALLSESAALDPLDSTARHGLAQLALLRGEFEVAEEYLNEALSVNPGNAYAHQTLALLKERLLLYEEAEELLRLAIRLEPEEPAFQVSLARLLGRTQRGEAAETLFERAVVLDPERDETWLALADFLLSEDRIEEGEEAIAEVLRRSPEDALLKVQAGLLWQTWNEDRAVELFQEALEIDPTESFALYNLAVWRSGRGELDEAVGHLETAIEASPRYPQPRLLLGRIQLARGAAERAIETLESARDLALDRTLQQAIEAALGEARETYIARRLRETAEVDSPAARWEILARLQQRFPQNGTIRNVLLEHATQYPTSARPGFLAESALRWVLESDFWKGWLQSLQLWERGERDAGAAAMERALESIEPGSAVCSTEFNLGNQTHSIHQLVYDWGRHLITTNRWEALSRVVDISLDKKVFGVVPDFEPLTVDSLMVPEPGQTPEDFSDFDVARHPDPRIHQLMAAMRIAFEDRGPAEGMLPALEPTAPDAETRLLLARVALTTDQPAEAVEFLRPVAPGVGDAVRPALLAIEVADLLEARGQREEAVALLEYALRRDPRNDSLSRRIQKLRRARGGDEAP